MPARTPPISVPSTPSALSIAPAPVKPDAAQALANEIPPVTLPAFVVQPAVDDGNGSGASAPEPMSAAPTAGNSANSSGPAPYAAISATAGSNPQPALGPHSSSSSNTGGGSNFDFVADRIRLLYEQVNEDLSDSPAVGDYAMNTLKLAREALLKQDFANAEFCVQAVEAKLKRSAVSMQMARSPKMYLLYGWEFLMLLVSALFIAVTYTGNDKVLGITVAPEFLALLRAVGWGGVGGVIGALYNLPWFIQFREYDPAYNMHYFARPLLGLVIGAVLFLISQAGILAGNIIIGNFQVGPIFLYVFAVLAGFKQEYVTEFIDNVMKAVFRSPRPPSGLKPPQSSTR